MCNVRTEHVDIMRNSPHVRGKSLSQLFPANFMANLPYDRVMVGHCIQCGRLMSRDEMQPPGRQTPRAMCQQCYDYWTSSQSDVCPICKEYLSNDKLNGQRMNPKEVSFRIHDGKCLDYFSIVSCKALGDDMSFLADENQAYNFNQFQPDHPNLQHLYEELQEQPQQQQPYYPPQQPSYPQPQQSYPQSQPQHGYAPQDGPYQNSCEVMVYSIDPADEERYERCQMNQAEEQNFLQLKGLLAEIMLLHNMINITHDPNKRNALLNKQYGLMDQFKTLRYTPLNLLNTPTPKITPSQHIQSRQIPGHPHTTGTYDGKNIVFVPKKR